MTSYLHSVHSSIKGFSQLRYTRYESHRTATLDLVIRPKYSAFRVGDTAEVRYGVSKVCKVRLGIASVTNYVDETIVQLEQLSPSLMYDILASDYVHVEFDCHYVSDVFGIGDVSSAVGVKRAINADWTYPKTWRDRFWRLHANHPRFILASLAIAGILGYGLGVLAT